MLVKAIVVCVVYVCGVEEIEKEGKEDDWGFMEPRKRQRSSLPNPILATAPDKESKPVSLMTTKSKANDKQAVLFFDQFLPLQKPLLEVMVYVVMPGNRRMMSL